MTENQENFPHMPENQENFPRPLGKLPLLRPVWSLHKIHQEHRKLSIEGISLNSYVCYVTNKR